MKRVFLMALIAALLGWMTGGVARVVWATPDEKLDEDLKVIDTAAFAGGEAAFAAPGSRHRMDMVPEVMLAQASSEVLKAREAGEAARERALIDALTSADLPLMKDGQWGEGYLPEAVMAHLMTPKRAVRPVGNNSVFVEGPEAPFDLATPIPVVTGPSNPPGFNPPGTIPDPPGGPGFIEIPSIVPEPATWALMILAFIGLALRLKATRRQGLAYAAAGRD